MSVAGKGRGIKRAFENHAAAGAVEMMRGFPADEMVEWGVHYVGSWSDVASRCRSRDAERVHAPSNRAPCVPIGVYRITLLIFTVTARLFFLGRNGGKQTNDRSRIKAPSSSRSLGFKFLALRQIEKQIMSSLVFPITICAALDYCFRVGREKKRRSTEFPNLTLGSRQSFYEWGTMTITDISAVSPARLCDDKVMKLFGLSFEAQSRFSKHSGPASLCRFLNFP